MAESTASLAAALSFRYRLERELGRGGMATVWLAHDLRHDRAVALKVLRPELSAPLGAARFQREICLTAQLQHPGILPLLDSGDAAGQLWYTMPYIEGGTLRERLRASGPLPVAEAVQVATAMAHALGYAHRHGVIHRDLKPENILLASSGPVMADLGIARALEFTGERLTGTGLALGTPEYMSPEQASAGGRVDGRSDIYALASVLYELLTGEPPYTALNAQAVIAKRISDPVPRVRVVRPEVPAGLEAVLTRALAKTPADRHATAEEFASALQRGLSGVPARDASPRLHTRRPLAWGAAAAALAIAAVGGVLLRRSNRGAHDAALDPKVVAVLPFTVTAPDSASNYLREGIVDLLNARLTGEGVPRAVDSRTTLAHWRRAADGGELSTARALAVAQGLGAGRLLRGEFVRTAARTTVRGRLVRVPGGELVAEHSETATAGALDELSLVDRWVGRVFASGEGTGRLPHLSDSAEAVKAYLAGRQAHQRGEMKLAVSQYSRALEIDSTFALAALWLVTADEATGTDFEESARRAWALRDRLSERDRAQLHTTFGIGPRYPEPSPATELVGAAEHAAQLNPDRSEALYRLGLLLMLQGAAAGARDWLPRAVAALDSAVALDSTQRDAYTWQLYARLIEGNYAEVQRLAQLYLRAGPRADWVFTVRWVAAHAVGDSAALRALTRGFERAAPENWDMITAFVVHAGLPLESLDRALRTASVQGERLCQRLYLLQIVAAARGQVGRALALADSSIRIECGDRPPTVGLRGQTMELTLADPGYGEGKDAIARGRLEHAEDHADGLEDPPAVCGAALWRLSRRDTLRVRRGMDRIEQSSSEWAGSQPCLLLLQAGLEALRSGQVSGPALARLDSAMRHGADHSPPLGLANLVLARRLSAQGDFAGALAAARRHPYHTAAHYARLRPAFLREEGRLAPLAGDTAGAIRAYQRYLRLRDRPDPGPMQAEVDQVKAHLAELVGEARPH